MKVCRFQTPKGITFGALREGWLYDLGAVDPMVYRDLNSLYATAGMNVPVMLSLLEDGVDKAQKIPYDERLLRIPVRPVEIWAAGVTYLRSRDARGDRDVLEGHLRPGV